MFNLKYSSGLTFVSIDQDGATATYKDFSSASSEMKYILTFWFTLKTIRSRLSQLQTVRGFFTYTH